MNKIKWNILLTHWVDEKTGETHISSVGNDTRQRIWKEIDDRKFILTKKIVNDYNKVLGKYKGKITIKNQAFIYRNEILVKPL